MMDDDKETLTLVSKDGKRFTISPLLATHHSIMIESALSQDELMQDSIEMKLPQLKTGDILEQIVLFMKGHPVDSTCYFPKYVKEIKSTGCDACQTFLKRYSERKHVSQLIALCEAASNLHCEKLVGLCSFALTSFSLTLDTDEYVRLFYPSVGKEDLGNIKGIPWFTNMLAEM